MLLPFNTANLFTTSTRIKHTGVRIITIRVHGTILKHFCRCTKALKILSFFFLALVIFNTQNWQTLPGLTMINVPIVSADKYSFYMCQDRVMAACLKSFKHTRVLNVKCWFDCKRAAKCMTVKPLSICTEHVDL